jgi:hypothetical protein
MRLGKFRIVRRTWFCRRCNLNRWDSGILTVFLLIDERPSRCMRRLCLCSAPAEWTLNHTLKGHAPPARRVVTDIAIH